MKRIERSRFMACVVIAVLVIAAGAFAASASNLRKIVVFVEGTSWEVQQQVIARSGSRVLNALPLIDGVAIELPAQGTEQALSTLKAEPTVEGVYDDPTIAAQGVAPVSAEGIMVYIQPAPTPTDAVYPWGLERIGIPEVHEDQHGLAGSGVKVAILDTGVDRNHPDLKQNITGGVNARAGENQSDYQDYNGHGTHIAGIIAARADKKKGGVTGAAPHIGIYAIKVLDKNGAGKVSDLISGLGWVRASKINLVNMSLGFPQEWGPYPALEKAIKRLYDAGVIMVAAAGNRNPRAVPGAEGAGGDGAGGDGAGGDTAPGCNTTAQGAGGDGAGGDGAGGDAACSCSNLTPDEKTAQGAGGDGAGGDGAGGDGAGGDGAGGDGTTFCYQTTKVKVPAAYPWVLAVGATARDDLVTDYSRSGPEMAAHGVVAPGGAGGRSQAGILKEGLLSTDIGGGYGLGIGTSQAAAHVTGTLALVLQLQRDLLFKQVLDLLKDTARSGDLPPEWEGVGVIDAERLVDALKKSHK